MVVSYLTVANDNGFAFVPLRPDLAGLILLKLQ